MQKSYTVSKKRKITYEWVIKDFTDHIDYSEDAKKDLILYSSNFLLNKDNDGFKLMLTFNHTDDKKDFLSYFLCWKKFDPPLRLKYLFYILDSNREKCNQRKLSTLSDTPTNDWGYAIFCKKSYLLNNVELLLPNGALTLGCDLTVYEDAINIVTPIYEYQPQCSITRQFKELLENQTYSDFTFKIDDKEFRAHKIILMTRCPVFKAMFESKMIEMESNQSEIKDIRPEIFKMMLEFIYTDKVEADLKKNDAMDLFVAADKYQLEDLKGICVKYLHDVLNVENVLEILLFAEQYRIEQLINNIKNFMDIYPTEVRDAAINLINKYH